MTRHTARLNGSVLDTGGQTPEVTIYYWLENAASTSSVALGPQSGSFSTAVSGLTLGTNYGYRVAAVNGAGSVTADVSFQTLSTDPIIRYVTPTGAGIADGTSWANAYSNLQEAVEECIYAGDLVCMQAGTYVRLGLEDANERSQCVIANAAGLTIRGGYAGTGSPGAFTNVPTILARNETALPYPFRRIIRAANSVLVLDSLTIARGAINESGNHGHGCYFASACDVTITNCIFASNGMRTSESRIYCGGAISSSGGTLAVVDSLLTNNILRVWTDNSFTYGGAIYSSGTAVTLERCIFSGNSSQSCYHDSQGGALCLNSGSASISGCAFYTNTVVKHETHPTTRGYGGTLYAKGLSYLNVSDCKIIGGYSIGPAAKGGLVYLEGTSQKAAISRTVLVESAKVAGLVHSGSLCLQSGTLALTNVLRAATGVTNAVDVYGGTLTAVNVTIADSPGYGIWMGGGTATLKHAIIWGNSAGGVGGPSAGSLSATYSDIQDGVLSGTGNRSADPLFADNVYFHLYSRSGFYSGFFDGGTWIRTRIAGYGDASPAIDVGDPGADCSLEPFYRGNIINLGAYGNTSVASKAYRPEAAVLILR